MPIRPERFHPGSSASGAKHRLELELDDSLSLPVLLVRGAQRGPTLVTTANIHGDEYEGVRAIFEIFEELDPRKRSGDWLAVPVANPPAFWNGSRTSPLDGANLARVFPGAPDGTPSERIAYHLAHSIIARADFYLDLHSGGVRYRMPSMAGYCCSTPRARAAAEIFGAPVIWGHPTVEPGRTVSFAQDRGIPWLYTEARGAGRIDPEDLEMMKRGILNLLRHLGVIEEPVESRPAALRLRGIGNTDAGLPATQDGFLVQRIQLLDEVRAGQSLGALVNPMGEVLEEYTAPVNGIVAMTREFPVVRAGDGLFLFAEREK
jgi:predicted deacylase